MNLLWVFFRFSLTKLLCLFLRKTSTKRGLFCWREVANDWFRLSIFRTDWGVRDDHTLCVFSSGTFKSIKERSQSSLKFKNGVIQKNGAIQVQIASLWMSQPNNPNQSIEGDKLVVGLFCTVTSPKKNGRCPMTVSTDNATSPKSANWKTQIPPYLMVQIQIEMLVQFELVPRNLYFSIWWISGLIIFSGICHKS